MALFAVRVNAQEIGMVLIAQAAALNDRGEWGAAVRLLEPLVQPGARILSPSETGIAFSLQGRAYLYLGEYGKARRSVEQAVRLLKDNAALPGRYAAALDNLGSLEWEVGQARTANKLMLNARELYKKERNHEGVARVANNLAQMAVGRRKYKEGQRFLDEAFQEARLAGESETDDLAAMHSVECALDVQDRNLSKALAAIQQTIDVWDQLHGEEYFLMGAGYLVRGEVYEQLGDTKRARADYENALTRMAKDIGQDTPTYLIGEVAYARFMRESGRTQEASQMEKQAKATLAELRRRGCIRCTVHAFELQ
jgi:tetratricopeptide (TPR) repeat protein